MQTDNAQISLNLSHNIINRREIEPLYLKAHETLKAYEKATNTIVSVLDQNGDSVGDHDCNKILSFCELCKKYNSRQKAEWQEDEYPCTNLHHSGIAEAQRVGGIYIYICEVGFVFWISPLFSNGHSAGALIAGGFLGIERRQAAEKISALSQGTISPEEAEKLLAGIPFRTYDEIKSMARILLLCAKQVSATTEDYPETIDRIAKQDSYLSTQLHLLKNRLNHEKPEYPLDKERMLLAALRRGDNETGRKILSELLDTLLASNPNDFKFMQFRAIELVVLLSRAAVTRSDSEDTGLLETNNRYLRRIEEAQSPEELTDILYLIVERLSGQIFSFQGIRHASALKKAERFIWENYTRKISLQEIADASGLSAPYFSSIFKEEMGENLSNYLNRLRVEKATTLLAESNLSLNEIALTCGFEDQSWFSKIFKSHTGISPGKYREQGICIVPGSPVDLYPAATG
ncbi:MAG: helix-turn-helix domain-containing protein [Spirochaetaceae bacterium]|jgi:AraC-like DNA-binding protein/ligand-binding sensor protein|nr:helix-turn-helix domain-containing protein [Spirochaetaceae bacterium]